MKKEMLINVLQPEECRIAIVEDGVLEELYVERTSHESYVGNIYKGRIVNIEPSIQAAFVDFGVGRNGFLHVSDVEPTYYRHLEPGRFDNGGRRGGRDRDRGPMRSPAASSAGPPPEEPELFSEPAIDTGDSAAPEPQPEQDRPQFMDSAERRTEDGGSDQPDTPPAFDAPSALFPRSEPSDAIQAAVDQEKNAVLADDLDGDAAAVQEDAESDIDIDSEMSESGQEMPAAGEPAAPEALEAESRPEPMPPASEFDEHPERVRRRPRDDRRGRGGRRGAGRPGAGRPKPLIQDIFKRGQEVLVQVIKEGIGTKGPTLSTYISIAGRYLVLMPGLNRIGVSRKIANDEQRRRLREVLSELQPPKGLGFIIRTAGLDKNKKELQRDLAYLSRLWQVVVRRIRKMKAPAEIYQESDMITRTIRDTFTNEIDTIWVDEQTAFEHAQEFLQIVMPRYAGRIKLYTDSEPMFHRYGIEHEIARIQQRHVPLPNGGSIVIDQTEALVAIDVNSGNFRADNSAEETAYQMNLVAAKEIARQLRLRDLGGVIVNDFIDMRDEKHRRGVERALREAVKRDRARTKILKISAFGIIEMTRQRIRPSLKRSVYQDCPHCVGTGQVKTCESMSIDVMRLLQLAAHRDNIARIQIRVADDVANYLLNKKRKEISRLEEPGDRQVTISGAASVSPETLEFVCYDNNNNEVKFLPYEEAKMRRR